jgi:hypothetical protein
MSKMASHEPFGHLQHKLWSKEGPGVKLAVWLATIKSRESTKPWCVQVECDTPLERSWWELQVCFKPHPTLEVWTRNYEFPKSRESKSGQFRDSSLGVPGQSHSDVGLVGKHREYYMGEGGAFPRVRVVVNQVSPCCPWLVPTPRVIPNVD